MRKTLNKRIAATALLLSASSAFIFSTVSSAATNSVTFGTTITGSIRKAANSTTKEPSYEVITDANGEKIFNIKDSNTLPGTIYVKVSSDLNSTEDFKPYNGTLDLKEGINYIWSYIIGDDGTKSETASWTVVKDDKGNISPTPGIDSTITYTPTNTPAPDNNGNSNADDADNSNNDDSNDDYNNKNDDVDNDIDDVNNLYGDDDNDSDINDNNINGTNNTGNDSDFNSNDNYSDNNSADDDDASKDKLPQTGTPDPNLYRMSGIGLSSLGFIVLAMSNVTKKNRAASCKKHKNKYSA